MSLIHLLELCTLIFFILCFSSLVCLFVGRKFIVDPPKRNWLKQFSMIIGKNTKEKNISYNLYSLYFENEKVLNFLFGLTFNPTHAQLFFLCCSLFFLFLTRHSLFSISCVTTEHKHTNSLIVFVLVERRENFSCLHCYFSPTLFY